MNLELEAAYLAAYWHNGQLRKYTEEPYIVHPRAVANIVRTHCPDDAELLAACWVHDVLEDTACTERQMRSALGNTVTDIVLDVSDLQNRKGKNRKQRECIFCMQLARASPRAQTLKIADIRHNIDSISGLDPVFSRIYIPEKLAQLEELHLAHVPKLYLEVCTFIAGLT